MDKRRSNQLLGLGCKVISTAVAVLTGHCVRGRHAERSLSGFVNTSRNFRECRCCLHLLPGRSIVLGNCWTTSSPELVHSFPKRLWLNWFKLVIARKFFRKFCSTARLSSKWLEDVLINYSVLVMTLCQPQWPCLQIIALWKDTLKEWGYHLKSSAMDAGTLGKRRLWIQFFANARLLLGVDVRLFDSPFLVSLAEPSCIDNKDVASFIKLSDWFSSVRGRRALMCSPCANL